MNNPLTLKTERATEWLPAFHFMYDILQGHWTLSPLMEKLQAEKKSARELQERKHEDWNDNYELYRNKVKTNRLTQRQAVNIPLMKETIKTLLSKIDDSPNVEWKERSGNEQKELVYQEIWNQSLRDNNLGIIDVLDKKNVLLYGISAKKLNIGEGGIEVSVLDPFDVAYDPLMRAWDIDSARFIVVQNIFRSVREILADSRYSEKGKEELKLWADSPEGILQSERAKEEWEKKMERLKAMGVDHNEFPLFAGGDRIVNLSEHYTKVWDTEKKDFEKRVVVYADDKIELLNETLTHVIGVDFWPLVMWAEDPETTDIYPDSVADLVRTPNKVLNVWFSQMIENRTLKNFQMHWFLPGQNYTPQTYTPGPGMMLPAPPGDDINKVIRPVEISGLDDTLTAIQALVQIVERGTGATAIEKGESDKGTQTLGEVQILVGKATERTIGMAKFYNIAWGELAWKWNAMMHANAPKMIKLFKTGRKGKAYPKSVVKGDWYSEDGYEPLVRSTSEQEAENTKGVQKFLFILSQFPKNMALRKIGQKRMLEIVDLTPDELREVEEEEKRMIEAAQNQPVSPQGAPQLQESPSPLSSIEGRLAELQSLG